ncbi:permease [Enterocloster bolteae]|uniref:permease n=1 Tax=Enterocloster bolteae TaxID=208479 RepID=UPI002A7EB33A|nr:permease [Enterocloster bolteae]
MKHKVIKAETMGPWKAAAAAYLAVFIFIPERSGEIGARAGMGLGQFIWNLVPVFLCVGLMDVWIERDKMIKMMGDRSGLSGMGISLLLGMLTAVPVYALLPIAGLLLKKGGRISNVLIFLCSSVSIRIPLLLFEISSLGIRFAACRFVLNLAVVFVISFLVERLLSERDRQDIRRRNQINEE